MAPHYINISFGASADIHGKLILLSNQIKGGGKLYWEPISCRTHVDEPSLLNADYSFHFSKLEVLRYIGSGVSLGVALPEPFPTPVAKLDLSAVFVKKTTIENFQPKETESFNYFSVDSHLGIRFTPFDMDIIDIGLIYSVKEKLFTLIGCPVNFGFNFPFTLIDLGEWGIIPFEGKIVGKLKPFIKLKLTQDQFMRWVRVIPDVLFQERSKKDF